MATPESATCRTLTEAFHRVGVPTAGRNIQQMWSGRSADGSVVAVTLWSDVFGDPDRCVYDTLGHSYEPVTIPAKRRRLADLEYARDKCGGIFRSIIVTPKNPSARPRRIAHREIGPNYRLTKIDSRTGEFRAERIRHNA